MESSLRTRPSVLASLRGGLDAVARRPSLVAVIYGVNLVASLLIAVPVAVALEATVVGSGFGPDLVRDFDLTLWADAIEDAGGAFRSFAALLLWMLPVWLLWKTASSVGIIHAVGKGGGRSFWDGVGRHTGRALVIAVLFAPVVLLVLLAAVAAGLTTSAVVGGEIGTFLAWWIVTPVFAIAGLTLVDLMQDFARIELVLAHRPITRSWLAGLAWPFRHPGAVGVYAPWFVSGVLVLWISIQTDLAVSGIWTGFLLVQLTLIVRAAVTVGWTASEAALFERFEESRNPVLADTAAMV